MRDAARGAVPRRAAAAARGSPAACELYNGSANEDASGMASATPDARPVSPREGGRSRSSARGGSGEKKLSLSSGNLSRKIVVSSGKTLLER